MEAAATSVSHGAMDSLLRKLGDLLINEYKMIKDSNDDVLILKDELKSMHAFLDKMSDMEKPDQQDKCWAKEVRELSYEIEDSVDEFMVRVEHESNGKIHGFKGFIERMNFLKRMTTKRRIGKEIQGIKSRVLKITERRGRYKIDNTVSNPNNTAIDPRMLEIYAETANLVGTDKLRDELIELMTREEGDYTQQLKVFSIWGFGGIGKTTLAKEIYHKLGREFQYRCIVSVSQKPNIRKIFRNILTEGGFPSERTIEMDEDELVRTIRELLDDKRYFIIIDDLWDESAWSIIRYAFPEKKNGSIVITTTRIEDVAIASSSNHLKYIYQMRPLSSDDSKKLFFTRIFRSEDDCPPYLKEVSTRILKICGGLPLAIITISSLLSTQRDGERKEQWDHILNSLGSNVEGNFTLESMRQILSLSYTNLPHYLKTCMLYLGIYPEDDIISKDDLVRQWVAQGFIAKVVGRDLEDVAENYFNELVNRSIIQPVPQEEFDIDVQYCRVHDMMLDLIRHKNIEDNFATAIDDIQEMTGLPDKVRRLSLNLDGKTDDTTISSIPLSQVRALARFGPSTYIPPLLQFKHLRVLTLDCSSGDRGGIIDLTGICHLFQLRYLKIVGYWRKTELPSEIQGLKHLETLEIDVVGPPDVPSDVVYLRRLLHLIVPNGTRLPDGIGNMKSLRTLPYFKLGVNTIDNIRELGELTNLRHLGIEIENVGDSDELETRQRLVVLRLSLEKLCNLRYLTLFTESQKRICWDELSSLSDSACPRLLRTLKVGYLSSAVPRWIRELNNLRKLTLDIKEVRGDDIRSLAQLPLTHLHLIIRGAPPEKLVIRTTEFPLLKHFSIWCSRISHLAFEPGAMPTLQWLHIVCFAQGWDRHGGAPTGIHHLSALKKITIHIGNKYAKESNRTAAMSALRNAVEVHPGRPTAEIKWTYTAWHIFDDFKNEEEQDDL